MSTKKVHLESMVMGIVIALVLVGGAFFVFKEQQAVRVQTVDNNLKRYDVGGLHHVNEDLIKYKREQKFKTGLKEVWGLVLDEQNELYVCGVGGIEKYTLSGDKILSMNSDSTVRFVGLNDKNELLACMGSDILVYDGSGSQIRKIQNSSWGTLNAVVQKGEFLYVADRATRLIWKCHLDGKIVKQMGSHLDGGTHNFVIPGPYMDVSLSPEGNLVTSNPGRHQVNTYSLDGKLLESFGKPSFKHHGFCGCCNPVALTVLGNGHVVTTEKGISRVKILDKKGELVGIVAAPKDFRANKHSFVVDLIEGPKGKIYMLDNATNEVLIYTKKEPDHV